LTSKARFQKCSRERERDRFESAITAILLEFVLKKKKKIKKVYMKVKDVLLLESTALGVVKASASRDRDTSI